MSDQPSPHTRPGSPIDPAEQPPADVCGLRHPLLKGIWCERLRGHPGRHAAATDTNSAALALEWGEGVRGSMG